MELPFRTNFHSTALLVCLSWPTLHHAQPRGLRRASMIDNLRESVNLNDA